MHRWGHAGQCPTQVSFAPLQVIYTVSVSNARPDLVREGDCPEELRDLIRRCWDKIPAERPSIEEVKTVLQGVSSYWSDSEESVGSLKGYP